MVDYSKFNKIAAELSDSDDETFKDRVQITKLDKPTTVSFGGPEKEKKTSSSSNISASYAKWNSFKDDEDDEEKEHLPKHFIEDDIIAANELPHAGSSKTIHFVPETKPLQKNSKIQNITENGGETNEFFWSQTADEVHLRVKYSPSHSLVPAKARDVQVEVSKQGTLTVKLRDKTLVQGKLSNAVWDDGLFPFASEEEVFQKSMTWELEELDKDVKCVWIRLHKRVPLEGVKMWWRRVFIAESGYNEEEVDVSKISARSRSQVEAAQGVWKAAHEMFLANRAKEREEAQRVQEDEDKE